MSTYSVILISSPISNTHILFDLLLDVSNHHTTQHAKLRHCMRLVRSLSARIFLQPSQAGPSPG